MVWDWPGVSCHSKGRRCGIQGIVPVLSSPTYVSNPNKPLSVAVSCHQISFGDIKDASSVREVKVYRRHAILKHELNFPLKHTGQKISLDVKGASSTLRCGDGEGRGLTLYLLRQLRPPPFLTGYDISKRHVHSTRTFGGVPLHRWSRSEEGNADGTGAWLAFRSPACH